MLARLLLAALLAVPFLWRLDAEEFHGDESHWISSGQQGFFLLTSGRFSDPQWRDEFYFYSQPQVGKLLIGAALAAAGRRGPTAIYDYDWQRKPNENRAAGRVPPDGAVLAGRVPGAIAGWLACLLIWAIAATLGSPAAGPLAATLLASHPLWLANARRAGLDATSLCFGLLAAWAVLKATSAANWRRWLWWLLAGAALGLAAGDKYVGLLPLAIAIVPATTAMARPWPAAPRTIAGGALAMALAGAVFFVSNPTLYRRPLNQLQISVDFLATQARDMRHDAPAFASPPFVAVEIFDRAIWPTGTPKIVDHTLPEPLSPGSYGTPVVAFGAALGLLAVPLASRTYRAPLLAAVAGTAFVYVMLALSIPTWWERWHLPLVPMLCLLAGMGLAWLGQQAFQPRSTSAILPAAQYVAALAMEPSYLGRGFGALALTPFGAAVHLATFALALATLTLAVRHKHVLPRRLSPARESSTIDHPPAPSLPLRGEGAGG